MTEFWLHIRTCSRCERRLLCDAGWRLLNDHAWMLARRYDPKRAKA